MAEDLVEVFHTDSTILAQKVLDTLLVPGGIKAVLYDQRDTMFPADGMRGGVCIAVSSEQAERAAELIAEARADGFLDVDEGGEG